MQTSKEIDAVQKKILAIIVMVTSVGTKEVSVHFTYLKNIVRSTLAIRADLPSKWQGSIASSIVAY